MAGLANVQIQIETLKGNNEYEKKKVLEPKNIADVRKFIAEKKWTKWWEAHEVSFQEWEQLVRKYESERWQITAATAAATSTVWHTVLWSTTSSVEIKNTENRVWPAEINLEKIKSLKTALENEVKSPLTPDGLSKILEKLKDEKNPDNRAIITSYIWSKMNNGGYITTITNNTISIEHTTDKIGATSLESTLQAYISANILTLSDIQRAMIVGPQSFRQYLGTQKVNTRNATTDGYVIFIMDARGIDLTRATTLEQKIRVIKGSKANPDEKAFLISYMNGWLRAYNITPEIDRQMKMDIVGAEIKASPEFKSVNKVIETTSGGAAKTEKKKMEEAGEELTWNSFLDNPMRAISKYPWTSLGLVIASIWQFGFMKTLLGALGGIIGYKIVDEFGWINKMKRWEKKDDEKKNGPQESWADKWKTNKLNESLDKTYNTQMNTYLRMAFLKEDINMERLLIESIQDVNYDDLKNYVLAEWKVPNAIKELIKDDSNKSIVRTYIEFVEQKNDAIATRMNIMRTWNNASKYKIMTLKQVNEKLYDTNNQFKWAISELTDALNKTNDLEEKTALEAIVKKLKDAQESWDPQKIQEGLGMWDMIWDNKWTISLVAGTYLLYRMGVFGFITKPISLIWGTFTLTLKTIRHPISTIKELPKNIQSIWKKNEEVVTKTTLAEKVKWIYSNAADRLQWGMWVSDFEHMDGIKSHLASEGVDTKFLDEFQSKVSEIQKMQSGTANYLKKENELRGFLRAIDPTTQSKILAYAESWKFNAPEQWKFVAWLLNAMKDARDIPIASRWTRFVVSLFKRI